ncbi:MAG: co-chaperone GroES [Candidatus Sungbacteria bacterium]|nr:co-chaperone GroES [Candidatus Sungbacteria bacterium]
MKIQPLGDRVVIEPQKAESGKLKSGLYLPETANKERPEQGTVIAVGPGKVNDAGKRVPMNVKKGDTVLFSTYREPIKFDDKEYLVLSEEDILAIIN